MFALFGLPRQLEDLDLKLQIFIFKNAVNSMPGPGNSVAQYTCCPSGLAEKCEVTGQ